MLQLLGIWSNGLQKQIQLAVLLSSSFAAIIHPILGKLLLQPSIENKSKICFTKGNLEKLDYDVITVHIPLSTQTKQMLSKPFFSTLSGNKFPGLSCLSLLV